jgi:hypothetical protein
MSDDVPLFETSREALLYALNATVASPLSSFNKAMAAVSAAEAKLRTKITQEELDFAARKLNTSPKNPRLRDLESAHLAGFILMQLSRLDEPQAAVLTGLLTYPTYPCDCGAPCCSGKRLKTRYVLAFKRCCEIVDQAGELVRLDGKKAPLSNQPKLRQFLIEGFLNGQENRLTEIARETGVSVTTAAKHREWVWAILGQLEDDAWLAIDPILVEIGLVGHRG